MRPKLDVTTRLSPSTLGEDIIDEPLEPILNESLEDFTNLLFSNL